LTVSIGTSALADSVIKRFGNGSGASEVGIVPGDSDNPLEGPQAIAAGNRDQLLILDQVNHRVLAFDSDHPAETARILSLPSGIDPTDLAVVNEQLLVWDQRPLSLNVSGATSDQVQPLSAGGEISNSAEVLTRFAQMGSQNLTSPAQLLESPIQPLSENLTPPRRAVVPTIGVGPVQVIYEMSMDRSSASVSLNNPKLPSSPFVLQLGAKDHFGTVQLLEVDREHRAFVLAENIPDSAERATSTIIARFKDPGAPDATYALPFDQSIAIPRRPVAVTSRGDVLFLRLLTDGVEVIQLAASPLPPDGRIGLDKRQGPPRESASPRTQSLGSGRARRDVIAGALAFESFEFTLTPSAYGSDPDHSCSGFNASRVRRPWYLKDRLGQKVRGVSYDWGGKRSLVTIQQDLAGGKLAGNVCTQERPRTDTTGVDCSGLVSEAWGLGAHVSTSDFHTIADRLGTYADLLPGDAIVKPGEHALMFLRWTPDGQMETIEAATGRCKGRVCRNIGLASAFQQQGYIPHSYGAGM
jgi:cell wall-associated NlpC family hydrolase